MRYRKDLWRIGGHFSTFPTFPWARYPWFVVSNFFMTRADVRTSPDVRTRVQVRTRAAANAPRPSAPLRRGSGGRVPEKVQRACSHSSNSFSNWLHSVGALAQVARRGGTVVTE